MKTEIFKGMFTVKHKEMDITIDDNYCRVSKSNETVFIFFGDRQIHTYTNKENGLFDIEQEFNEDLKIDE